GGGWLASSCPGPRLARHAAVRARGSAPRSRPPMRAGPIAHRARLVRGIRAASFPPLPPEHATLVHRLDRPAIARHPRLQLAPLEQDPPPHPVEGNPPLLRPPPDRNERDMVALRDLLGH